MDMHDTKRILLDMKDHGAALVLREKKPRFLFRRKRNDGKDQKDSVAHPLHAVAAFPHTDQRDLLQIALTRESSDGVFLAQIVLAFYGTDPAEAFLGQIAVQILGMDGLFIESTMHHLTDAYRFLFPVLSLCLLHNVPP